MKSKKISKLFYLSFILIFWILIFTLTCKNPSGPGIDFNLRNWYIMSGMAKGPGFTNNITYGNNTIIYPSNYMKAASNMVFSNRQGWNYRIPELLALPNGDLLAFADRRYNGSGDLPNRIEVYVKKSTNNGTNWGPENRVTPTSSSISDGYGDTAAVLDRKTGNVIAVVAHGQGFFKSTSKDPIRIITIRSRNNGESWEAPIDITSQIYGAGCSDLTRRNWQGAFVTSGNGLQLRNGRLCFVLVVRETTQTATKSIKNYLMYSDDGGHKWKVSRGSPRNDNGGNEAKVVELNQDGHLLMNIRPNGPIWKRYLSRSYDYGETWTEAKVQSDLPSSGSNGDTIYYTSTLNGYDKNRLITLVDSRAWNGKPSGYPGVPVFYVSYDEGMTWTNKKTLYQHAAGYSSLAILKDGSIGILAELGNSWNGPIYFLKTSIEWCNPNDNPCSPTNTKK